MTITSRKCYICLGKKTIEVSVHDDDGEEHLEPCVCVRCRGTGVLTDGFGLDQLPVSKELDWQHQTCNCDYHRDGPMGHPRCPAR